MARTATLFTREACGLCHEMREVLDGARAQHPFELLVIDLDTEATEAQREAYTLEVPVLELDGRKVAKYRIDEARLLRLLEGG